MKKKGNETHPRESCESWHDATSRGVRRDKRAGADRSVFAQRGFGFSSTGLAS